MTGARIGIDARLVGGTQGGVEHFVLGLASGLGKLNDGSERYQFLAYRGHTAWLEPYLGSNSEVLYEDVPLPVPPRMVNRLRGIPGLNHLIGVTSYLKARNAPLAVSTGSIERAKISVMHFTLQSAFMTSVPSIYHPHDLQHLHLPEFFSRAAIAARERMYRTFCDQARMVAVSSSWTKNDLVEQYNLASQKIHVVPLAPVNSAYCEPTAEVVDRIVHRLSLPEAYIFYPAQTWPHKNHLNLLAALAKLRDQNGLKIDLVCAGKTNNYYASIQESVGRLGLNDQVKFLGFVSEEMLQVLYARARAVVIPTRFEAASFPLWEAFLAGVPAACSQVTSLPEQAGDAALLFHPDNIDQIANCIMQLWTNSILRDALVERGRRRVAEYTWDKTARRFRALYRTCIGGTVSQEDKKILQSLPLM